MTEQYGQMVAAHYAAYRPSLHQLILGRLLSEDESFEIGLDVGCGTGYSAAALAKYCMRVYGIDPSPSMLQEAAAHKRVIYREGAAERVPLPDHLVNVVTFAGSLFYADTDMTCKEVSRVCRDKAVVIVYDFEVLLEKFLRQLGTFLRTGESAYNHRANFSDTSGYLELVTGSDRVNIRATPSEAAHVLLSDAFRFDYFAKRYRTSDPFRLLAEELQLTYDQITIEADIYYSKYRIKSIGILLL